MKKVFVLWFSVLVPLSISFAQPKLQVVEGSTLDLGEMFQGEKVERNLTIKNVGNKPLVIDRVQASCGCTATLLADKNVEPGKTTSLLVSFDSKNFSGIIHKSVSIFSNEPDSATREIRFTANVTRLLESSPPIFSLSTTRTDTTLTSSVLLKNLSNKSIEILGITCDEPGTKFNLKKKELNPGEAVQLTLTFTPSRIGYVYKQVVVKTSHPKQAQFTMYLVCNVQASRKPN